MVSAVHINELDCDAQTIGRLAHASLQQGVDSEASTDFAHVHISAPEMERGAPGGDAQAIHVRQSIDQFLRQTLAEKILVALGAQVRKGQDGNGSGARCGCAMATGWGVRCL